MNLPVRNSRDNRGPARPNNPQQRKPKPSPTPVPPTLPGKASPFYEFLNSLDQVSRGKGKIFIGETFKPPVFEQDAIRIANHFDPTVQVFQTGRVRSFCEEAGYGFLMYNQDGLQQTQFFMHASGYEQPEVKIMPPSESIPYTMVQIQGKKFGRGEEIKKNEGTIRPHILPIVPQRDESIAFARWVDPKHNNEIAGRWMPQWMFDRVNEIIAILSARAATLMRSYRVIVFENEVERELLRTNFPIQAVAAFGRISKMKGEGQEVFLQDCETLNIVQPEDIRWDSHPLVQLGTALTAYASNQEAKLPE